MQETQVRSLGWVDSLEKGTGPTPVLPGEVHGHEEPGGLYPRGSKVGHDQVRELFCGSHTILCRWLNPFNPYDCPQKWVPCYISADKDIGTQLNGLLKVVEIKTTKVEILTKALWLQVQFVTTMRYWRSGKHLSASDASKLFSHNRSFPCSCLHSQSTRVGA